MTCRHWMAQHTAITFMRCGQVWALVATLVTTTGTVLVLALGLGLGAGVGAGCKCKPQQLSCLR